MFLKRIYISSEAAALFALLLIIEDSQYPVLLMLAALIHECGHVVAALICGASFRFGGAGLAGVSIEYNCLNLTFLKEIIIAVSGALANVIAAVILDILNKKCFGNSSLAFFAACNFILGFINIIPVKAFDGGAILKCALLIVFNENIAEKIYIIITSAFSVILWVFAIYIQLILGGNLSLLLISIYILTESFSLEKKL